MDPSAFVALLTVCLVMAMWIGWTVVKDRHRKREEERRRQQDRNAFLDSTAYWKRIAALEEVIAQLDAKYRTFKHHE